jgi:hypothetical protein
MVASLDRCQERGAALLIALQAMTLLLAIGAGLMLVTSTETRVASAHQEGDVVFYAAEAGLEIAMAGVRAAVSPTEVLAGRERPVGSDGPPIGTRPIPGGREVDLGVLTNQLRCGRARACTESEMNAVTLARPWGTNNPRWQPYVFGPLSALVSDAAGGPSAYVVVWVGDDPLEDDGNPAMDASDESHPGHGLLVLHAEAFGAAGRRRALEATVARLAHGLRVHSWKELR